MNCLRSQGCCYNGYTFDIFSISISSLVLSLFHPPSPLINAMIFLPQATICPARQAIDCVDSPFTPLPRSLTLHSYHMENQRCMISPSGHVIFNTCSANPATYKTSKAGELCFPLFPSPSASIASILSPPRRFLSWGRTLHGKRARKLFALVRFLTSTASHDEHRKRNLVPTRGLTKGLPALNHKLGDAERSA